MSASWVYRPPLFQRARLALVPVFFAAPLGDISGSATIAFSETAALSSYGNMAASEAIAFSETAALGAYASTAASETISFSETAVLDAITFGDMAASEQIVFSEVAGLDGHTFKDIIGSTVITFFETAVLDDAKTGPLVQPILPIHPPHIRSIDAKTLADHFNRGQPQQPDYEWPNARKFYQDDSPA